MLIVAAGTAISPANPLLVFYGRVKGALVDQVELSFQVFRAGTQVFPASVGVKQAVDVEADRLSIGRYAATWDVTSGPTAKDRYEIRWFSKLTSSSAEVESREAFEVVATLTAQGPFYAGPADLATDEAVSDATPERMLIALSVAGRMLEAFTRTWFEPRYVEMVLDGGGFPTLHLQHGIVAIGEALVDGDELDLDDVVIYNRHLGGMTAPDDRKNPKIVRAGGSKWARGAQNIELRGVFGCVERGPAPWGMSHPLARHVAKLIAVRELGVMGDADVRDAAQNRYRIVSEATRDQSVAYSPRASSNGASSGPPYFTGDPEIDQLILMLRGPINVRSV
jgi:hypothetical protein